MTHDFQWWERDFRFITEAYYKQLWDIVPYDLNNVKIRYSGENNAKGYAVGIDARLNGEFVPGVESYFNLSLLQTAEKLDGVQHYATKNGTEEVNYVPRPSDQFVKMAILFQDYFSNKENIGINFNFVFASGLPFGAPGDNISTRNNFRYDNYFRLDAGFLFQLWKKEWLTKSPNSPFKPFESIWLSAEVFNLLDKSNSTSNTWIRAIDNAQYAIPNYTTSRRFNLRLKVDF